MGPFGRTGCTESRQIDGIITGVLGLLLRARREGKLPSLQTAMGELREKAGFRIGAELFADLVKEDGETKR